MPTPIQNQIQAHIQSFAQELEALVRQAAVTAVAAALGTTGPRTTVRRGPAKKGKAAKATPSKKAVARPAKKASKAKTKPTKKAAKKAAAKKASKPAKKVRGSARSPEVIGAAADKILGQIKTHPGQRSEDVRKAVGTAKNIWILAISKLIEEKKITKKGAKRATTFTAR